MVAVDASRLAPDYGYAATLPRGSRVFAVGWDPRAGVLLIYAAKPYPDSLSMEEVGMLDEIQRFWFVPVERIQEAAPTGTLYVGCVSISPTEAMAVFAETQE